MSLFKKKDTVCIACDSVNLTGGRLKDGNVRLFCTDCRIVFVLQEKKLVNVKIADECLVHYIVQIPNNLQRCSVCGVLVAKDKAYAENK